jgi:hypothetical protein
MASIPYLDFELCISAGSLDDLADQVKGQLAHVGVVVAALVVIAGGAEESLDLPAGASPDCQLTVPSPAASWGWI